MLVLIVMGPVTVDLVLLALGVIVMELVPLNPPTERRALLGFLVLLDAQQLDVRGDFITRGNGVSTRNVWHLRNGIGLGTCLDGSLDGGVGCRVNFSRRSEAVGRVYTMFSPGGGGSGKKRILSNVGSVPCARISQNRRNNLLEGNLGSRFRTATTHHRFNCSAKCITFLFSVIG
jgi:hypothetical protein